jgi:iron complex outermembrane receptor protein
MRKGPILFGSLAVLAWAPMAQAVEADPVAAESGETLRTIETDDGSIIVTAKRYVPTGSASASKTDISLIETPQSVSVVTRDQIDLLNFIDAQQAVRYTSGVFGENYGPDLRYDFITVRGFTPKQYIDGLAAPVSTTIYSVGVDLYAFESFDILKGPASVLYGSAPPGGIYNQTSRRASTQFGGEISAKYGNDNYKQIAGTVTGEVVDGVAVRLTGLYRDRDAERDLVNAKRLLLAPTATWEITPDTRITGLAYYQRDVIHGDTNGFLPVFGTLLPNPLGKVSRGTNLGDPDNYSKRRQGAAGFEFEHDFSSTLKLRSSAKWNRYKEEAPRGVYGQGGLVDANGDGVPDDYRTVGRANFTYREYVSSFTSDNRIDATVETGALTHKILVGLDYRNVLNSADFGFFFNPGLIDLFNPVYTPVADPAVLYPTVFNKQRLKQTGVYAQDQIGFGDLFVTFGARQDWVKVENTVTGATTKQDKLSWRVGANYVTEAGIAPYVSYATSFEPVLGTDSITGRDFKPSTGKQVEAGVKYDARGLSDDVKLFATAAVFDIQQKNVVSTAPSVTPVFGTQTGEVEVYGAEFEVVTRIREQLAINASYSYTHSEVKKSSTAAELGAPLATTPKHKLSLFADYTIARGPAAGLGFGFGGRYHSRSAGSLPGPFNPIVYDGDSSTLFDAIVHYDTPGWRLAINGSNIFDKTYVARCSGPAGCNYGAGRQVIGTVTKKF